MRVAQKVILFFPSLSLLLPEHRYGLALTRPVLVMAKEICPGEMPSFDPRSCSEAKKRPFSSDGSESLFAMCPKAGWFGYLA